jgi:hypothetical protein
LAIQPFKQPLATKANPFTKRPEPSGEQAWDKTFKVAAMTQWDHQGISRP